MGVPIRRAWANLLLAVVTLTLTRVPASLSVLLYSFEEGTEVGTMVADLRADTDLTEYSAEVRSKLTFKLMPTEFDNPFVIDSATGIITNYKDVDREKICAHSVHNFMGPMECYLVFNIAFQPTVRVKLITIKIQIRDVNDQWPRFSEPLVSHQLSEATTVGSGFSLPRAVDSDSPPYSVAEYKIQYDDPADSKTFQLKVSKNNNNKLSGQTIRIVTLRKLDYESKNFYKFQVKCFDGGNPPKIGTLDVTIKILDANDHIPKFDQSVYKIRVAENFPVNDKLLTVHAEDGDSGNMGTVRYSLGSRSVSRYSHIFTVDQNTGDVYLSQPLDYETSHLYHLVVVARDLGENSQTSEAAVVIHVTDINDAAPLITVNTPEHHDTSVASVSEAGVPGRFVAHVQVLDLDSLHRGQFNCSLAKNDQDAFSLEEIYAKEYQILTTRALDREHRPTYVLTIECQDHGSPSKRSRKILTVNLIDVNDQAPKFKKKIYNTQIYENNYVGAYISTVNATDSDKGSNARLEYSLTSADGDAGDGDEVRDFVIDRHTGRITAARLFDRETSPVLRVRVVATDNGLEQLNSSALLIVKVVDVDDNPPVFLDSAYSFGMHENEPIGTQVGIVTARDIDSPANADFNYFIQPHKLPNSATYKQNEDFSLDSRTGKLVSKRRLDRESYTVFHFVVIAESKVGSPKKKGSATVSVYLADRNDNAPEILYPSRTNNTISISSLTPPGYIISKVKAYDPDAANNAKLTYSLVPKMPHARKIVFSIEPKLGLISLDVDVSTIQFKTYALQLQVQDSGMPHLSTVRSFFVNINSSIPKPPPQTTLITRRPNDLNIGGQTIRRNVIVVAALACISILVMMTLVIVIAVVRRQERQRKRRKTRLQALKMLTARDAGCCQIKGDSGDCSNGLTSSSEASTNIADMSDLPPPPPPNEQLFTHSQNRPNVKREVSFQDDIPDEEPLSRSWFNEQQAQIHKLLALLRQQDAGADVTSESLYAAYYYDKTSGFNTGCCPEDGLALTQLQQQTTMMGNLERATDTDSGRGSGQLTDAWSGKDAWRADAALKVIDRPSQPASNGMYLSGNQTCSPSITTPRRDISDTSNQIVPDVSNISYASDSTAAQYPSVCAPGTHSNGTDRHHSTANELDDLSIRKPDLTFGTTPMRRGPRDREIKKALMYSCANISEEASDADDSEDLAAVKRRALTTPTSRIPDTPKNSAPANVDLRTPADFSDLEDSSFGNAASTYYTVNPTLQDQTIDPRELVKDIDRMFFDSHV